uniref:HTH psq-type domain-containing protein n=1 Tax=Chrysemys picta bellii TaxID=8478 RepID=A0A8C3HMS2_CHRPI
MSSKRPASSGSFGNADKRKHESISIQQKVELLQKLEKSTSVRALCEFYNVGSSTVHDLKNQRIKSLSFLLKLGVPPRPLPISSLAEANTSCIPSVQGLSQCGAGLGVSSPEVRRTPQGRPDPTGTGINSCDSTA